MWRLYPLEFGYAASGKPGMSVIPLDSGAALLMTDMIKEADLGREAHQTDAPATNVSHDDAEEYARTLGMRLPTQAELQFIGARFTIPWTCWLWTSTPRRKGWAVCGGAFRDNPSSTPSHLNVSWDDNAAADISFRCVRTLGVYGAESGCLFCGGSGKALISETARLHLNEEAFFEGMPIECRCGAVGVTAMHPMDMRDAVAELLFDALSLKGLDIRTASTTRRTLRNLGFESEFHATRHEFWLRSRG